MIDLRGKRAIVSGGSRGIGAATVQLLARAGADVVVGYRARAAVRQMPNGGRIVLVSSTAGQRGEANHADYAAS